MKWLFFITNALLLFALVCAKPSDGSESTNPDSKTHKKRELFGNFGKFASGHDVAHVKHSYLKPLLVQYPAQTFPIGVKIPLNNPHLKRPHHHHAHHHHSPNHHFHIQTPIHLPKPVWPTPTCNHGQASHPVPAPLPPPTTPLVPTPTDVSVLTVPVRPALTPPLFEHQPFIPLGAPSIPIAPVLPAPLPIAPVAPIAPIAPLAPLKPILPAPVVPVPSFIKPGLSTHSFTFATFPRHHYINTIPAVAPAPAPAPLFPAPQAFLPHAHLAPVAPLVPRIPLHHIPAPLPLSKVPLQPLPFHVGKIPLGVAQPHLFNQIPVNFPVAHAGLAPLPAQAPVGVSPLPQEVPTHTHIAGQPLGGEVFPQPQHPLFQHPSAHFPTNSLAPEENGINPGFQEQGNHFANSFPSQPGVSNVWTPMTNPTLEQTPTFQYPQQEQFPSQVNPDTSEIQPQGAEGTDHQGYTYQQNGNQQFEDGQNIQQNLQQQAEQQFLQAQQFFSQQNQQQQSQEQNQQYLHEQQNQQYLEQQQQFNNQQQQYAHHQQQEQQADDVQQFSQQQFVSGPSGDPQHDPQLPQALPDHPLAGKPINQAYIKINHRRRLRKRPQRNQEQ